MTSRRCLLALLLAGLLLTSAFGKPKKRTVSRSRTVPKSSTKTAKKKTAPSPPPSPPSTTFEGQTASRVDEFLEVARQTPMENVAALVPFFEQLYRFQGEQNKDHIRILHYGDSHTAADEWTGFLRALFQNRFGDGGSGYTHPGRPWNSFRRLDLRSGGSNGWYSDGLVGRAGDGMYGLGGVSLTTARPRESVSLEVTCETLEVLYLRQPGGGALNFFDNGQLIDRISTDGELAPGAYRYQPSAGLHRFELETLDSAPVRLFGWVAEQGRGVTYETLGINGAQASIVFNWQEAMQATHVAHRSPALIVLAYGTNEAGNRDWSKERYREMFASLIHRFRRMAPAASILVVGPPDRYVRKGRAGWQVYDSVDRIVEAQREAALGTGCAFWDMRAKMGGKGSMRTWVSAGLAQRDYVHFTASGYRLLGGAVFQDLMDHFQTFLKVRRQVIGQNRDGQTSENP
ncbi:MAG: SGNH/GDSL hydrolase family protein [Bryobacterales bacterium]|nr:SGNH/GDSL hydrolase family protein [Bryobacterales bacterium]